MNVEGSIKRLLEQYPQFYERKVIEQFLNYQFQYAMDRGVNPDYCYHYYGKDQEDAVLHGVSVQLPDHPALIPMKIMAGELQDGNLFINVDLM